MKNTCFETNQKLSGSAFVAERVGQPGPCALCAEVIDGIPDSKRLNNKLGPAEGVNIYRGTINREPSRGYDYLAKAEFLFSIAKAAVKQYILNTGALFRL